MTATTPEQDENTPLLSGPSQEDRKNGFSRFIPRWTRLQWQAMLMGAFLVLLLNFGAFLGTPAQLEIFEDIICQNYKRTLDQREPLGNIVPDGDICKSEPVQSELAAVIGWKNTLDILPSLALGLPYGVLADKIGRRPVVILSLGGLALSEIWPRLVCWFDWPLRLVWLTGLFRAPGGGDLVATSMLLTVIADVFSAEQRATALFRLGALSILAEIVATPISAATMTVDPWIPYILGVVLMLIGALCSVFIPETLDQAKANQMAENPDDQEIPEFREPSSSKGTVFRIVIDRVQEFFSSTKFMWQNPNVLISLAVVFASTLDKSSLYLLIQYVSTKYHWSISQATYLISLRGCMSLTTFLLLVPVFSSFLIDRLHYSAMEKDLSIAKVSAASGILGYFLLFIAPTPAPLIIGCVFMSLSMPFVLAIMSLATTFVTAEHVATLYSAMSVSQSIGIIVAGPAFAKLYGVGLRIGLAWSGLPFAVSALIFVMILIPVLFVRLQNAHA